MAKKALQGLDNMFNPNPKEQAAPVQEETTAKEKGTTKPICYNLNPDIVEAIAYIAYYDRKKANAVVTEALTEYIRKWNNSPHTIEEPKKINI